MNKRHCTSGTESSLVKRLCVLFAIVPLAACPPRPPSPPSDPFKPGPTPVGTPSGERVTASIGPEGGTLVSGDKVLELVVPPGAVTSPITFGVQPITNTVPGGTGAAYRLTPDGVRLEKPVTLSFAYAAPSSDVPSTRDWVVIFQGTDGVWRVQGSPVDAGPGRIQVESDHFTDFSVAPSRRIKSDKGTVRLGGSVNFTVEDCIWPMELERFALYACAPQSNGDRKPPLPKAWSPIDPASWRILSGAQQGTVRTTRSDGRAARYTAPTKMPANRKVIVTVSDKKGTPIDAAVIQLLEGAFQVRLDFKDDRYEETCTCATTKMTDLTEITLVPDGSGGLKVGLIHNEDSKLGAWTIAPSCPPSYTVIMDKPPTISFNMPKTRVSLVANNVSLSADYEWNPGACRIMAGSIVAYAQEPGDSTQRGFYTHFDLNAVGSDHDHPLTWTEGPDQLGHSWTITVWAL